MNDCDPLAWIWSIERTENEHSTASQWNATLVQFPAYLSDFDDIFVHWLYQTCFLSIFVIPATERPISERVILGIQERDLA